MRGLAPIDRYWGVRALEFVTALEAAHTCEDVLELFRQEIAQVGFHSHLITTVDDRDFSRRVIARSWHPEWVVMYEQENMTAADPVRRKLWHSTKPFLWSEARYDPQRQPRAKLIMRHASDFDMKEGLCVPIHEGGVPTAAINISGKKPDLGSGVRAALHVMSLFLYNRYCTIMTPSSLRSRNLLTKREREVLQWVSVGKTDWDISVILHISERTVRAHVANAAHKLHAATRPAAIAAALHVRAIGIPH